MDWKDAYINNALQSKGIKDDELQAASEYVTANLNDDDSNFSEVLEDLNLHFDLDDRPSTEDETSQDGDSEGDEDTDYKALAKQYEEQLNEMKVNEVEQIKRQMLSDAGYSQVQADYYSKYIEGENEESLRAGIDQLKRDVRPASEVGDPNIFNPPKAKPRKTTAKDLRQYGGKMYNRIKHKRHY